MSFTKRFILLTSLLTFLLAAPFLLGGFLLPAQYGDTFLGEFPEKYRRLLETESPRILLVGGSGMAFGIESPLLEEAFPGYQAVNLGMYADLGTKITLDILADSLQEGDIVILAPEQNEHALSLHFGASSAWQAFDGCWGILRHVGREDIGTLLGALPTFSLEKWRYFLSGERPKGEGIYRKSSFNWYGDIESPLADANRMPDLYDPLLPVSFSPSVLQDDYARYLCAFAKAAARRKAQVLYYFCPVNRLAVTGEASPEDFYACLQGRLSFPLLGDPRKSVLEEAWFYDTNFHLNQSGRTLYTRQLIRDLKAYLGITTPTLIPIPGKPPLPAQDGRVLTAEAWAGNEEVLSIEVPADVYRIEDYAFSGCSRLQEIRLLGTEPSRILIGEHLLDGTGAVLVVPSGTLSAYRTNYRFSRYAQRIREGG